MLLTSKEYRYYIGIDDIMKDVKFVLACSNDDDHEIMSAFAYPDFSHMEFYIADETPAFKKEIEIDGLGLLKLTCYKANHNSWN